MDYNAAVTGWGWYSPAQVLTNQDLEKLVTLGDVLDLLEAKLREAESAPKAA